MTRLVRPYEARDLAETLSLLPAASDLFTPAHIGWSAPTAAQSAFDREHFGREAQRATTQDFLAAIDNAKPMLTPEMIEEFLAETGRFKHA